MPKVTKAYRSKAFLSSTAARPLRILSEYLEPKARFDHYRVEDTIVFYGSARIPSPEQAEERLKAAREAGEDTGPAEVAKDLSRYHEAARQLAYRLTRWSKGLGQRGRRFVICSGGGPGIMEAANRGASEAKGLNIGLNISLPIEESYNPHITRELQLEFHYFFMRKFWFAYLAKAIVVMPGGFGTLDELFEILTLVQTRRIRKHMPIVLFGTDYWGEVINFEALARYGTINEKDIDLCFRTDSVDEAFEYLTEQLGKYAIDDPGATL
ncbi:MAG: LOG family protein [Kiloniellales bacterium]|nr:LOG family protein [Kiloniellales bacterium]